MTFHRLGRNTPTLSERSTKGNPHNHGEGEPGREKGKEEGGRKDKKEEKVEGIIEK